MRVFIDWTFTKTALDLFQWIKLAQIQADLFKAKSTSQSYFEKKLGKKIPRLDKILVGFLLVLMVVFLIVGPLLLFSTLSNSFGTANPISQATFKVSLNVSGTPYQLLQLSSFYRRVDALSDRQY